MKTINFLIALVATLSIMSVVDLMVIFTLDNNVDWGWFGKDFWVTTTTIGRASIGWFFGMDIFKRILNKLEE